MVLTDFGANRVVRVEGETEKFVRVEERKSNEDEG